jgi:hypothetical protein
MFNEMRIRREIRERKILQIRVYRFYEEYYVDFTYDGSRDIWYQFMHYEDESKNVECKTYTRGELADIISPLITEYNNHMDEGDILIDYADPKYAIENNLERIVNTLELNGEYMKQLKRRMPQ